MGGAKIGCFRGVHAPVAVAARSGGEVKELATAVAAPVNNTSHARATIFYSGTLVCLAGRRWVAKASRKKKLLELLFPRPDNRFTRSSRFW